MLLGRTQSPTFFKRIPPQAWMTEAGLLDQVVVYGCTGSGRTETLLAMAINAATQTPAPTVNQYSPPTQHAQALQRSVVMMDGNGDNTLHVRTTAALLARKVDRAALRVINLMTGAVDIQPRHKLSHSVDLFDGMDEYTIERWLRGVLADNQALTEIARGRVDDIVPGVVRLAVTFSNQTGERLRPSDLGQVMTEKGLKEHAQREGEMGGLAQQLYAWTWGDRADPVMAQAMTEIHQWLQPLWTSHAHVFNSSQPELSLHTLFDTPAFVLILAPSMERAADHVRALTRSITCALHLNIKKQPVSHHCRLAVFLDRFNLCLDPKDLLGWRRVGNHGTAVVWGDDGPETMREKDGKPAVKGQGNYWPQQTGAPGTHVLMHQCSHPTHGGHYDEQYMRAYVDMDPKNKKAGEHSFGRMHPGEAVIRTDDSTVNVQMSYIDAPRPTTLMLERPAILDVHGYSLSGGAVVVAPTHRQARVLLQRWQEWQNANPHPPSLAWTQETLARMLGFSNWHEASKRLGKPALKQAGETGKT